MPNETEDNRPPTRSHPPYVPIWWETGVSVVQCSILIPDPSGLGVPDVPGARGPSRRSDSLILTDRRYRRL